MLPFDVAAAARVGPGKRFLAFEHAADRLAKVAAVRLLATARARIVELSGVKQAAGPIEQEKIRGACRAVGLGDFLGFVDQIGKLPLRGPRRRFSSAPERPAGYLVASLELIATVWIPCGRFRGPTHRAHPRDGSRTGNDCRRRPPAGHGAGGSAANGTRFPAASGNEKSGAGSPGWRRKVDRTSDMAATLSQKLRPQNAFPPWTAAVSVTCFAPPCLETLSPAELLRYSRHLLIPAVGEAGQLRLKNASVLLIGTGALGSPAAHVFGSRRRRPAWPGGCRCGGCLESPTADSPWRIVGRKTETRERRRTPAGGESACAHGALSRPLHSGQRHRNRHRLRHSGRWLR